MKSNCLFCKIIEKKIKSFTIYEDDYTIAFLDAFPIENGHTLVVPKKCLPTILNLEKKILHALIETQQKVTKILARKLKTKGFNFIINHHQIAGQEIAHYHLHIIPKFLPNQGYNGGKIKKSKIVKIETTWKKVVKD